MKKIVLPSLILSLFICGTAYAQGQIIGCCKHQPSGGAACESITAEACDEWGGTTMSSCQECWDLVEQHFDSPQVSAPPAGYEEEIHADNPFFDVDPLSDEGEAAIYLYENAIAGGYPTGDFKGDKLVNRGESAKFLLNGIGEEADTSRKNNGRFSDVEHGSWYEPFVMLAAELGIIEGDEGKSTFRPGDGVNTAEFLAMLARAFKLDPDMQYGYTDVVGSAWYAKYAGIAWKYGLFQERGKNLGPDEKITRYDVAMAIKAVREDEPYERKNPTPVNPPFIPQPTHDPADVDDDPSLGDKNASLTLIAFTDYQCPFCKRFNDQTLPQLKEEYIEAGKLRYVVRDYPLSFHNNAKNAALASECADDQGAFWAMHDMLFEKQGEWSSEREEVFEEYADKIGLNTSLFNSCYDERKHDDETAADLVDGQKARISGTPGFWVIDQDGNGKQISGAQPYANFKEIIDAMLRDL